MTLLQRLNPAVPKRYLMITAGLMWTGVGVMLCWLAYGWLTDPFDWPHLWLALAGIAGALPIYRFGFRRMAHQNVVRIRAMADRACLFSFMAWKSYIIVPVMITMGILLRNSPIPKPWLAVMYIAIGGGLFLSSFVYYGRITVERRERRMNYEGGGSI